MFGIVLPSTKDLEASENDKKFIENLKKIELEKVRNDQSSINQLNSTTTNVDNSVSNPIKLASFSADSNNYDTGMGTLT